jgi:hypothetical protein
LGRKNGEVRVGLSVEASFFLKFFAYFLFQVPAFWKMFQFKEKVKQLHAAHLSIVTL